MTITKTPKKKIDKGVNLRRDLFKLTMEYTGPWTNRKQKRVLREIIREATRKIIKEIC